MPRNKSVYYDVKHELKQLWKPPREFIKSLLANGVISVLFFLGSLFLGTYNEALLPVAAATLLLWTLADVTICNQIIFDKHRAMSQLDKYGSFKRLFIVNNLTIVILSIPITILFGLLLVAITGRWSEIINGLIIGITLIWGWLGISNFLSVILPFDKAEWRVLMKNRKQLLAYSILYALPWVLMPIYVVAICLPFILTGWIKGSAPIEHKLIGEAVVLTLSFLIWYLGLSSAVKYANKPDKRLSKLLNK